MSIDDFFRTKTEMQHPRLRAWRNRLPPVKLSGRATLEVFRPNGEFGTAQPEMYVQFYDDGRETELDQVPWEDELNAGLIELRVKAAGPEQEAERFALGLRSAMKDTVREFGDGYFNAVLVELIRENDLTEYDEIAKVFEHAYANKPHREGGAFDRYTICHDRIASAIEGRAKELKDKLEYSQEIAGRILVAALASYLDERFSVSSRRQFGLL